MRQVVGEVLMKCHSLCTADLRKRQSNQEHEQTANLRHIQSIRDGCQAGIRTFHPQNKPSGPPENKPV